LMWVTRHGCRQSRFRKCGQNPEDVTVKDCFTVTVHDNDIFPPIRGAHLLHAKCLASEMALTILPDESSPSSLSKLCSCPKTRKRKGRKKKKQKANNVPQSQVERPPEPETVMAMEEEPVHPAEPLVELPTALKELDKAVDDETVEGFTTKGQQLLEVLEGSQGHTEELENEEKDFSERDEEEVDRMLLDRSRL